MARQASMTKRKPPPVDLSALRVEWDAVDADGKALDERKWKIARQLCLAYESGLKLEQVAQKVNRHPGTVGRWVTTWRRYRSNPRSETYNRNLTFTEAIRFVQYRTTDRQEISRRDRASKGRRYIANASTDERVQIVSELMEDDDVAGALPKSESSADPITSRTAKQRAKLAAELLEDDDVQKELAKAPERGGKVAAALIENDNVAAAARRLIEKRRPPAKPLYTKQELDAMGKNGPEAQAKAHVERRLGDELDDDTVEEDDNTYVDDKGDVYDHGYDREDPDSPFIETKSGSKVNWHSSLLCTTPTPDEIIGHIEAHVERIIGPMYTLGTKDKRRLRRILKKGMEALK